MDVDVCGIASTAEEALKLATLHNPDFVLMDVRLHGERDGIDAALDIYNADPDTRVIFVTGSREQETMDRIAMDHPAATLFKPITHVQLRRTIEQVIQ